MSYVMFVHVQWSIRNVKFSPIDIVTDKKNIIEPLSDKYIMSELVKIRWVELR